MPSKMCTQRKDHPMGRTLVITGASSGFGEALARLCAARADRLVLLARRQDRLQALAQDLTCPVLTLAHDVRDIPALQRLLTTLPKDFADVDVLVNNAGLALGIEKAQNAVLEDWLTMIDTNNRALVAATHALLPSMLARGQGHIVNLSSIAGHYPYSGGSVYCASKAFVTQFSLALRADLIGTPIRVTNIEPGMTAMSEFSLTRFKGDHQKAEAVYKGTTPLTSLDIAKSILWAIDQPPHVNINRIELMPVCQAPGGLALHRQPT
jgi:3-hydroxy acid dehydrogenase / malonic semialdehyde reductase